MSESLILDKTVRMVRDRLNLNSLNQKVISGNLANMNTPGYVAKGLSFEEVLRESEDDQGFHLVKSSEKHLDPASPLTAMESPELIETGPVDLDTEMVNLSKNSVEYNFMVAMLNKKLSGLKDTIQQA
jgi:flagellar basal-body rod protein FlgB